MTQVDTITSEFSFAKIKEIKTAYKIFQGGHKSWILILHGWNQHGMQSWLPVAQILSTKFNVITVDLPAFGQSQPPKRVWNTADYSEFVIDFIDYLMDQYRIKTADLNIVSHSFGGSIACLVATRIDLDHLILVAPAIYRAKPNWFKSQIISVSNSISQLLKPFWNYSIYQKTKKIWQKLVGAADYSQTNGIKSEIFKMVVCDTVDQELLTKITAHTLLIWGQKDMYTPFIFANKLQLNIPNSKLISYPNINHGVHIHNKNQLTDDIINFCK
jgi:pimeloyl-ACP methyl ester carboxylesterase